MEDPLDIDMDTVLDLDLPPSEADPEDVKGIQEAVLLYLGSSFRTPLLVRTLAAAVVNWVETYVDPFSETPWTFYMHPPPLPSGLRGELVQVLEDLEGKVLEDGWLGPILDLIKVVQVMDVDVGKKAAHGTAVKVLNDPVLITNLDVVEKAIRILNNTLMLMEPEDMVSARELKRIALGVGAFHEEVLRNEVAMMEMWCHGG